MPSVKKINSILELLRQHHRTGLTNKEISERLSIPPSTCYRILADLKKYDYVSQRKPDLHYMLGFAHMRYAESMREGMDVTSISLSFLEDLHRVTDETTFLALLNNNYCVVMEVCGNINTRIAVGRGELLPLHASAAGKAVLAFLPQKDRTRILEEELRPYTDATITEPARLAEHLSEIRRSGVSYNVQEFHKAINALATPLFGDGKRIIGSIALVGFSVDLDEHQMQEYAALFIEASAAVTEKLGAQFPRKILDYHKLR